MWGLLEIAVKISNPGSYTADPKETDFLLFIKGAI
jgi:hypothetical protein